MKKLVTTPITNTIWWATVNEEKGMITGNRQDVTDNAIQAVVDHLKGLDGFIENGFSGYVYDKTSGGTFTLCLMDDDKYTRIYKDDLEKLKEYKHMYEELCK